MTGLGSFAASRSAAWKALADWTARHRLKAAYLIVVLSWLPLVGSFGGYRQGDVGIYEDDAQSIMEGRTPYRDTLVEYPPYALPVFLLPRVFGSGNYLAGFMLLTAGCDLLIRGLLIWIGMRQASGWRSLVPLLLYSAAVPFLGFFFLQRFDLWPALICLVAMLLFCANRPAWSGLAIAVGIGVKVYPALFAPPLFVLALRQGKGRRFCGGLAAGLVPMLALGLVMPWWRFAQFQGDRGLQCESLFASLIWGLKRLGLTEASWVFVTRWVEVHGVLASALLGWARLLFIGTVLFSAGIATWAAGHASKTTIGSVARLLLVPLLAFIAFNQVFSPQFMIWLLPLAALGMLEGNPRPPRRILLATVLTPAIFPSLSGDYGSGLNIVETTILIGRNLILVVVWWALVREQWRICRGRDVNC